MPIFDTHAHYTDPAFDADRDTLLAGLPARGVGLVLDCGTDLDSSLASLALGARFPFLYTAAGIHPESLIEETASTRTKFAGNWRAEMDAILPLYENPKVVAVGECGLDYHWPIPKEEQLALFEAEIRLSLELDLPIVIHDREAHADTYALLRRYRPKGVVHCYSGSAEDVRWLTKQGLYIGFGGVTTFKNARKVLEAAAAVPEDKLLIETDAPYMAPVPYRGRRNDSGLLCFVAETLAALRGIPSEALLSQTMSNGCALFGIAPPSPALP
ncbi:MAG TPA: TatD family hydrolase [Candidatus Pygmaiobacter gallistercoris]|nr:TatD family hydrolase [Candidatus Pygmaiobacter gallistercoris]